MKKEQKMNRILKNTIIVIAALVLFAAGTGFGIFTGLNFLDKDTILLEVKVLGDVQNPGRLNILKKDLEKKDIDGKKAYGVGLEEILSRSGPLSEQYKIYFLGEDGRTAAITNEAIDNSYLYLDQGSILNAINYDHPVSTNIKDIREIIIVSESEDLANGLNIISAEKNIDSISHGEAYLNMSTVLIEGGSSVKESGSVSNRGWIYERTGLLDLEDFIYPLPEGPYVFMGRQGGYEFSHDTHKIGISDEGFYLFDLDSGRLLEDLAGMVAGAPAASIMDLYHDSLAYIQNGQKVMAILVDGFSYIQFEKALEQGYISFSDPGSVKKALSVYKPVTNSGLAAMLTGVPPYKNGVYSRDERELKAPDIFEVIAELGKSSVMIEGNIGILDTSIEPVLNTDSDDDGDTDDEIFETALGLSRDGHDMVFIHFHGLDDRGHDFGDLDPKTLKYVKTIDSYIKELAKHWDGKIIITADHGMHGYGSSGDHGEFRFEDLIVPYIVTEGDQ